ncbi:MAG: type VI secretion system baseplate subunit TssG [Alphaproteobacteria bacterium]
MLNLCGVHSFKNDDVKNKILLTYSKTFWTQSRSRADLTHLLQSFFRFPIAIEPFKGRWRRIYESEQSCISFKYGQFRKLGYDTILGRYIWNQSAAFNIKIGPMPWSDFCSFLPLVKHSGINRFNILKELCYMHSGIDNDVKIILTLNKDDCRSIKLSSTKFFLGHNTWLKWHKTPKKCPSSHIYIDLCSVF